MKSKNFLFAVLAGWVIPWMLYSVAEQVYLSKPQQSEHEKIPVRQQTEPATEPSQDIMVSVRMKDGSTLDMELNDYLTEVVLGEMPAGFEPEALKAQAIVARTYTLKHTQSQNKHDGGAVCTDPACCQAYCAKDEYLAAGNSYDRIEKVKNAVADTGYAVLLYGDELIDATYFSCAGDRTEEALAVWGTDVPYLQSVESPGEEISDYYVDSVTFSIDEFMHLLDRDLPDFPESWIGNITYTAGGGVDTIDICGESYKGTELRQMLGLRSTDFQIAIVADTVTVTTKGYGHRVGMSQYGAQAMALQGKTAEDILSHYYPGTRLETRWDN